MFEQSRRLSEPLRWGRREKTAVAGKHPEVVERLKKLADQARLELGDTATKTKGKGVREPGKV